MFLFVAAKVALRRKKVHEKTLEQTTAQITQLEQQIYSIEAANINFETLAAMKKAGDAMKQIHGGMTIDKVDKTMDELREQQNLSNEISEVISGNAIGEQYDEDELDAELEGMEQEAMDKRMLDTGTVPVSQLERLPAAGTSERKWLVHWSIWICFSNLLTVSEQPRKQQRSPKKMTMRQSWPSCVQKWLFDTTTSLILFLFSAMLCRLYYLCMTGRFPRTSPLAPLSSSLSPLLCATAVDLFSVHPHTMPPFYLRLSSYGCLCLSTS